MKITPEGLRQLAARACTSRQNLYHRGIVVKHSAKKNRASALKYADAMANVAVQSTNRAGVLYEFAGVQPLSGYALEKMVEFIGCDWYEWKDNIKTNAMPDLAIQIKQWMLACDKAGDYDRSAKIAGAWAFYCAGEWNEQ